MEFFFPLNTIFVILITIVGTVLGFWVYSANRKAEVNKIFFLMSFFIILWVDFAYFSSFLNLGDMSQLWAKLGYGMASLFFFPFYLFSNFFPIKNNEPRFLVRIIFALCLLLFILSVFTNFLVQGIEVTKWGFLPVVGNGKFTYFGIIFLLTLFITGRIFIKYFKTTAKEKIKVQYLLIGLFIFILTNLIFNVILPFWQGVPQYYQFGNYSAIFLLGFTAYAIVKQKLFGIKIVLTQILVAVIAILLFIQFLSSENAFEYTWKGALLAVFLFFGYLLVKSVLREVKLREELERTYEELKKLDMAKSEFISITSHQLRTPLTAVKGYISMILDGTYGNLPESVKEKLQNVFQSNERLIRLINDLLNVSRIESGKIELNLQKISIEDIISNVIDILKNEAKHKKISIKWDKPKKPLPKIVVDPDKVREIILNIADNAVKYTQEGEVRVSVKTIGGSLLIIISDTGAGLSRDEINKMFRSFSRGSAGSQHFTEGVGLGLYIARKFIELHQGKIWVESEGKGKGSKFYIALPIISPLEVQKFLNNF